MSAKESEQTEYIDVSNNLQHWNTLPFAELTIFITITGTMMNVVIGGSTPLPQVIFRLVKASGFLAMLLFLVLQKRTMTWWYRFVIRTVEREEVRGFDQYCHKPQSHSLTGRIDMRIFFIMIIIFWFFSIFLA